MCFSGTTSRCARRSKSVSVYVFVKCMCVNFVLVLLSAGLLGAGIVVQSGCVTHICCRVMVATSFW